MTQRDVRLASLSNSQYTKPMSMKDEFIPFLGYEWLQVEDGSVTVGISEEGLEELTEVSAINLPAEGEEVNPDEVCGEVETESGPLNLYSPVEGKVVEINAAVVENPQLLFEDPYGDGWLFRVEATDPDDLDAITNGDSDDDE
ncbi:MAG: glycine cleavage system protein H [Bdellovibrionales bacterium]|nr:glycine cleavage system protein H [Bdellovibrionales bacterium]